MSTLAPAPLSAADASPLAIDIERVSFQYPGAERAALDSISLRVFKGERLGILGPNGGGKSTLLKLVLGLLPLQSGAVRVLGRSPIEARRAGLVGYVPQRAETELALPLSVREVVTLGAAWRLSPLRRVPSHVRDRVSDMIRLVGAEAFADRPIGKLSGGQMQRVLIARALASDAKILVLDEPMVGIDAAGQQTFARLLAEVHARLGLTIIVVTHDLRAVAAASDRVACLARRLHSHVSPEGLTPQVLAELFSHDVAGLMGTLGGMHVHAHGPGEPCEHEHAPIAPVRVQVSAKRPASAGEDERTKHAGVQSDGHQGGGERADL